MNNTLKVGIDIHGVIDAFPERFRQFSCALPKDGVEVYVITRIKRDKNVDQLLAQAGILYTHYFSIVDHLEGLNEPIDWFDGLSFDDDAKWNIAKREYCDAVGIDFMFDDTPTDLKTFNTSDTTYLHVINLERKIYKNR
jgi:hypothetical protein